MAFIEMENLVKAYQQTRALNGVNLSLEKGGQYAIRGASGSGKSTLLYLLGGLDFPSQGKVVVGGNDLAKMDDESLASYRNLTVGFVFQFHFLLTSMNCWDNIMLPSQIAGQGEKGAAERSKSLATELGVEHCLKKFPYELSGGEQQRVNIIRALSLNPDLLLCDEPTGNLDSINSEKVTRLVRRLANDHGATLIVVTHDAEVGQHFSHRFEMQDGKFLSTARDKGALNPGDAEPPPLP